jgi:hypothetical protein
MTGARSWPVAGPTRTTHPPPPEEREPEKSSSQRPSTFRGRQPWDESARAPTRVDVCSEIALAVRRNRPGAAWNLIRRLQLGRGLLGERDKGDAREAPWAIRNTHPSCPRRVFPWKYTDFGEGLRISQMKFYALANTQSPNETLDLFVTREAAEAELWEILEDEPDWKDVLRVLPIELDGRVVSEN